MDSASELIKLSSSDSIYGTLSNFDIEKKIGKGQFSVVYRARCKVDHAVVALKKVQIFEMMDSKARLDCMKEINLLQVGFVDAERSYGRLDSLDNVVSWLENMKVLVC